MATVCMCARPWARNERRILACPPLVSVATRVAARYEGSAAFDRRCIAANGRKRSVRSATGTVENKDDYGCVLIFSAP